MQPFSEPLSMRSADRPLSPHLQIYRWQLTMALSILHRATGLALGAGTILLVWWLVAGAAGPGPYRGVSNFLGSWIGLVLLFGWTASLAYHLCNGIRHLVWDTGHALDLRSTYIGGWIVVAAAAALTVAVWIVGLGGWVR
jgi:succinate dehydrogenase / fumarate reductase cytochrome b subunit